MSTSHSGVRPSGGTTNQLQVNNGAGGFGAVPIEATGLELPTASKAVMETINSYGYGYVSFYVGSLMLQSRLYAKRYSDYGYAGRYVNAIAGGDISAFDSVVNPTTGHSAQTTLNPSSPNIWELDYDSTPVVGITNTGLIKTDAGMQSFDGSAYCHFGGVGGGNPYTRTYTSKAPFAAGIFNSSRPDQATILSYLVGPCSSKSGIHADYYHGVVYEYSKGLAHNAKTTLDSSATNIWELDFDGSPVVGFASAGALLQTPDSLTTSTALTTSPGRIVADTTLGPVVATLPKAAAGTVGQEIVLIKSTADGNAASFAAHAGDTISGDVSTALQGHRVVAFQDTASSWLAGGL